MRIEDYGLIGDLQTAALVGLNGSIDWLCLPRFDSGACFSALLGDEWDGRWLLAPDCPVLRVERRYRERTLVHELDFHCESGSVRVIDFMPPRGEEPDVVRIVEGLEGSVPMRLELVIRFEYGSIVPWVRRLDDETRVAIAGPDALSLRTPVPMRGENLRTVAEFTVEAGQREPFVLTWYPSHRELPHAIDAEQSLGDTCTFWREWLDNCTYTGRWEEPVTQSLMVLKALTYQPTGGIVAAPTTSLPEQLGGVRNWDYRYCWLRDATFALDALLESGFEDEARRLAELAAASRCRRPGRPPDHVRPGRRAEAAGARAAVARGLRGIEARPGRQRRQQPVPARRLRRGDGRPPPGQAAPHRAGRPVLGAAARAAREPRARWHGAGRGDLGGPRAAPPLHPLEGDGVGGVRPRRQGGRGLRPRRARSTAGGACATRSTRRCSSAATTTSSARSSSPTTRSGSTPAC